MVYSCLQMQATRCDFLDSLWAEVKNKREQARKIQNPSLSPCSEERHGLVAPACPEHCKES